MFKMKSIATLLGALILCASTAQSSSKVLVDGSSTVFPISEAVGEEFQKANPQIQVAVASSGTGGGFKKFCKGELDLTGASRPIETTEIELCKQNGVDFVELPVAYDGIAIVVNPQNTWAKTLTTAELKKIWEPNSKISNWKDVRAGFPDMKLTLYGPGPDSGTFDYFTKVINLKEKASRPDFSASESDFVLVRGVAGDKGALGYFGFAYYESNASKLGLVGVDAGKGAVLPNPSTISSGVYSPLSRPVFVYASTKSLARPEVKAFTEFYIDQAHVLVGHVGYVSLGQSVYSQVKARLQNLTKGSMFDKHEPAANVSISELLNKKAK